MKRVVILSSDEVISDALVEEQLKLALNNDEDKIVSVEGLPSSIEKHLIRYFESHEGALPPPGLYNRILREIEYPLISLSLNASKGNQIKAAKLLGMNRNTLRKKISELDINVSQSKKMM